MGKKLLFKLEARLALPLLIYHSKVKSRMARRLNFVVKVNFDFKAIISPISRLY